MRQENLLNNKEMREQCIGRLEILDRVGDLLLLSNTEFATMEQISIYYNVGKEAIKTISFNNRDELLSDGIKELGCKETKSFLASCDLQPTNFRGYFESDGQRFANSRNILFPKRAILRIGMLLRDSEVAKEIRTRLLDVVQDAQSVVTNNGNTIIENVVNEITEEKQLMMDRVEAEMQGDYAEVSVINAKLFNLKNKRILELEKQVETITSHSLTVIESRSVINRMIRLIATKEYNGRFGEVWNELWCKTNYKLHINVKARKEKPLDSLSEEEMFSVEEIARTWANSCGIDVINSLTLAS